MKAAAARNPSRSVGGSLRQDRVWWAHQDSNLEPTDYESAALTVELWARIQTNRLDKNRLQHFVKSRILHQIAPVPVVVSVGLF